MRNNRERRNNCELIHQGRTLAGLAESYVETREGGFNFSIHRNFIPVGAFVMPVYRKEMRITIS